MTTWSSNLAVIDTETTGTDVASDRLVELGVVLVDDGHVAERHAWLVNPGMPIPAAAIAVHGIDDRRVALAPSFEELAVDIGVLLEGRVLAAFNAPFDRAILHGEWTRAGMPPVGSFSATWIDALVWARHVQHAEKGKKLDQVAQRLGVQPAATSTAHRALADALTCTRVLFALARWMPTEHGAVVLLQEELRRKQQNSFRAWRSQRVYQRG